MSWYLLGPGAWTSGSLSFLLFQGQAWPRTQGRSRSSHLPVHHMPTYLPTCLPNTCPPTSPPHAHPCPPLVHLLPAHLPTCLPNPCPPPARPPARPPDSLPNQPTTCSLIYLSPPPHHRRPGQCSCTAPTLISSQFNPRISWSYSSRLAVLRAAVSELDPDSYTPASGGQWGNLRPIIYLASWSLCVPICEMGANQITS